MRLTWADGLAGATVIASAATLVFAIESCNQAHQASERARLGTLSVPSVAATATKLTEQDNCAVFRLVDDQGQTVYFAGSTFADYSCSIALGARVAVEDAGADASDGGPP